MVTMMTTTMMMIMMRMMRMMRGGLQGRARPCSLLLLMIMMRMMRMMRGGAFLFVCLFSVKKALGGGASGASVRAGRRGGGGALTRSHAPAAPRAAPAS
jgi:hypothetical protein